jgi:2-polyprenyl-3-methyl-5-hydroxy-6-metoxy-1,4-benzoquinol methylase
MSLALHRRIPGLRRPFLKRDAARAERDAALAERNTAVAERDAARAERDAALAERKLFYLKESYERHVAYCKKSSQLDEAMSYAVGGEFDLIGDIECAIMQYYGLEPTHYLIDVGCGSGRLAKPLSNYLAGRYLGTDLVQDLVDYARRLVASRIWFAFSRC